MEQVARACAVTDNALDHSERQRKKHRKKNARRTRRSRHDANNEDEWSGLKKVVWVARPGKRDVGATPRSQAVVLHVLPSRTRENRERERD
jgi:hypothetical protein